MIIDATAAPRPIDPTQAREWLASQRVFISSALADTSDARGAVAEAITREGAHPVWFEELGRDAPAEEAYLAGVDSSTIYFGMLNEVYGAMLPSGFSPTETEYMRARERGKRLAVFVASRAPAREGHLRRFIDRVQVFLTTEPYNDVPDLVSRATRRLYELAAEDLSPWVKLGRYAFRVELIDDRGDAVMIHARAGEDVAYGIESMRNEQWGRQRVRLTYPSRVCDGEVASIRRTTRAGSGSTLEITLERIAAPQGNAFRTGLNSMTTDDLVEAGLKNLLFGESLPQPVTGGFGFFADTGVDAQDLHAAFESTTEIVESLTRLVLTEGLVGSGNASRVTEVSVGPRVGGERRIAVEWIPPHRSPGDEPPRRRVDGDWHGGSN